MPSQQPASAHHRQLGELVDFIRLNVPGQPVHVDDVEEVTMQVITEYQKAAHGLWRLLEKVSKFYPTNNGACEIADRRSRFFVADGDYLFRVTPDGVVPYAEPVR